MSGLMLRAQVIAEAERSLVEEAGPSVQEMFREHRRARRSRPPEASEELEAAAEPAVKGP